MDLRAIMMGLAFAVMWSSAFTSARVIVLAAPPMGALALRFLVSGVIAIVIALALGQTWRLTRPQWRATIIFGICQNALYLGLNFVAMQTVQASLASIIASAMPLIVALASWLWLGERMKPIGYAGLMAGVLGVAIIMGARLSGGADPLGIALCIGGVLSLALATLSVRGASGGGNVMMIVGLQMLVGSALLWPLALAFETFAIDWSWQLGVAFSYTVLVPGVAATFMWMLLVNRIGATQAATFHFLNPVFGVGLAALLLGESMSLWDAIGVAIVTVGILAVQRARASV
ncbi:DMT family transporter [Citreicella sp. C3M06]|uniref:DMT family transporter n=1 Tax=Citreicella sp. C3M06 TaxID=2841564 RepID=UPI001C09B6E3|nr:DMT family transporter [Citreicella sp. C3M06]MBU2959547.1 DMT family transporter [Citreicella sp. C3M06]